MANDKKVIIIEDDKDINDFIAYNLRKEGFAAEQVLDGLSATQRIKEEVFNIVILDIMLPGIDGFEICAKLKDDPRYAQSFIVVISAKCRQQDKLYAYLLGADCYLTKPFSLECLLKLVIESSSFFDKEYLVKMPG